MYSLVTVISVLLSLAVFIDVMMSLMCIYNSETNVECYQAIISRDPDHGFYSGVFFGAVTLGMMITAVPLCQAIRTLEKKSIVMSKQIKTLVLIFSVFSLTYFLVTIFDFSWKASKDFDTVFIGLLLDLILNFFPILLMAVFHFQEVQR